jgi:hypothetical protein
MHGSTNHSVKNPGKHGASPPTHLFPERRRIRKRRDEIVRKWLFENHLRRHGHETMVVTPRGVILAIGWPNRPSTSTRHAFPRRGFVVHAAP